MSMRTLLHWSPVCLLSIACARGPNVGSDDLALRRVVVYRNGVGYFERSGKVTEDEVRFSMRQRLVGDFLASLAVIEAGGSSVRSASFPLEVEDQTSPRPTPGGPLPAPLPMPLTAHPEGPAPPPPPPAPDPNAMRSVVLHLDGKEHDLAIGYLSETPVWRPSYRVVIGEGGRADLQAWGIVQNLSGEDWHQVSLSLVAGAPLAFQSTLATPVIPQRPIVTDEGEVVAVVPTATTSLAGASAPQAPQQYGPSEGYGYSAEAPAEMALEEEAEADESATDLAKKPAAGRGRRLSAQRNEAAPAAAPMPVAPPPAPPGISPPRRISDLAAVALEAGTTRYDLPYPVTVPNESATMVLLTSQQVPGEAVLLFAPEPGVNGSEAHPFRVARFQNSTNGMLERGPIAVFEKGSFLGQGLLEPLPPRATATVPFALERGVGIVLDEQHDEQAARLYRIEAGRLWIERDGVRRSTYRIDNGGDAAVKLLIKHARNAGTRLFKPPPGTEDNTGTGSALLPTNVAAHGKTELVVEERRGVQRYLDWLDPLADTAVNAYIADARADRALADKLKAAWAIRETLRRATDEMHKLTKERGEIERLSQETRGSLRAIEKNPQAGDLRARLTTRLDQAGRRLDALTKRGIELQMVISENEVRFRDAVQDITLSGPLPAQE
jgi:hypothetical protein